MLKIDNEGNRFWYLNGKFHRLDGAAIEWSNGDKEWYANGLKHRDNGPAVEWSNGTKMWYKNGELYRIRWCYRGI